jgi:putative flippase GtrA
MIQRIRSMVKARKDTLIYIFFGALTTLVNYAVYFPLYNITPLSATFCSCVAWIVSVIFAFLTNKPFVFNSHDWSTSVVIPELLKFVSCRVVSGALESLIVLITIDLLNWNGNIWKILTGILVIILNYVGSKVFVFASKK